MSEVIDWGALARQLGAFEGGEIYSSDMAKQAIEVLLGKEILLSAVDYYISGQPGSELARFVLWQIRPWSAMQYCYKIYKSDEEIENKRAAIELLRVVGDRRALKWVDEFLDHHDVGIQVWGMGLLDRLLWSDLVEPEEAKELLKKAKDHQNPQVRDRAKFVRKYLKNRKD